jgi:signal transduction histidine kinase
MRIKASFGEVLLRMVGGMVWAVVGSPSWSRLLRRPAEVWSGRSLLWLGLYLLFALAFWIATAPRAARRRRRAALAVQSGAAIGLALLGMPHFEGALLAVVAAQTPALVPPLWAVGWSAAQAVPLFVIILPTHQLLGGLKATSEYLAFSLFAMGVVYLREREAAARRELARSHSALIATQSLLADGARTHERLRIARELHDSLGHGLTAASIHLQLAERTATGATAAAIAAAQDAVRGMLSEVRGLVGTMREGATVDLGTALRALCAGIAEPVVRLTLPGPLQLANPELAHALFRCVQEALTNALRHAGAQQVWIQVETTEHHTRVVVRDDGSGVTQVRLGNGLQGLCERLNELGGGIEIEPGPGTGLVVRAWLPREEGSR